jgi:hypothetical protein
MRKSKFSESQIAFILRQADEGAPIVEVCRKARPFPAERIRMATDVAAATWSTAVYALPANRARAANRDKLDFVSVYLR